MESAMTDSHGRRMRKLRVSLLDQCHFRCLYCMPQGAKFMPRKDWLPLEELTSICKNLVGLGIEEIRLTGGEPTLRPDFMAVVEHLAALSAKKLALTTNGELLCKFLPGLWDKGLHHINISLNALTANTFHAITGSDSFSRVMESIQEAHKRGFKVKINMVLMKGKNDGEVEDFVRFSEDTGIEVRFLELMKIGVANAHFAQWFISAGEVINRLKNQGTELIPQRDPLDATAFTFRTGKQGKVGFIASESRPFCGHCSRLRLTATGSLLACLFKEEGLNLRGVSLDDYPEVLGKVLGMKPTDRMEKIHRPMYQVGG